MNPTCIDLYCGYGGWANGFLMAGYRVIGYDIEPKCAERYPGEFVQADVRELDGRDFSHADAIVASPPCQEFSDLRFLRKNPKQPDMSCVDAAFRIRRESGVPTVIENVRGARKFFPEKVATHRGAFYLWGDVPLLFNMKVPMKVGAVARARFPDGSLKPSRLRQWGARDRSQKGARERAMIPIELSYPLALSMRTLRPESTRARQPTGVSESDA